MERSKNRSLVYKESEDLQHHAEGAGFTEVELKFSDESDVHQMLDVMTQLMGIIGYLPSSINKAILEKAHEIGGDTGG